MKNISSTQKAYIAGFLDGDGSIYVRMKPNSTYKYGFQISSYIVLFQSQKEKVNFEKICSLIGLGYIRERRDGILEYIIGKEKSIRIFLGLIKPFLILKQKQANLMLKILDKKSSVKNIKSFQSLADLIERFRELNYSKKRKRRVLTP
mgnify:CR=1 FL=1